jgi:hypothetical protein
VIDFAKIVVAKNGHALVAVREANFTEGAEFELHMHVDNSFEIYMNGVQVGHVKDTPPAAIKALLAAPSIALAEISPKKPPRYHTKVRALDK